MTSAISVLQFVKARWALFALALLYIYLTVHILSGSQGIMKWADYETRAEVLSHEVVSRQAERADLEREAAALASATLQADVLDMRARERLYASRDRELILRRDR